MNVEPKNPDIKPDGTTPPVLNSMDGLSDGRPVSARVFPTRNAPVKGLANRAIKGTLFLSSQAMLSRVVSILGTLTLSMLLIPESYGQVALANIFGNVISLVATPGFDTFLIQRGRRHKPWVNPIFWLTAISGAVGLGVILLLAPVCSWLYQDNTIGDLMIWSGVTTFFAAIATVPLGLLNLRMQFGRLALFNFMAATAWVSITVALAWLGFGPYSFVMSGPILSPIWLILLFYWARPKIRRPMQLSRVRKAAPRVGLILGSKLGPMVVSQGDYLVLGAAVSKHEVGVYFWAFSMATQLPRVLAQQIISVITPVMGQMHNEGSRQINATLRGMRLAGAISWPLVFLQATCGTEVLRWMFSARWSEAFVPFQLLSIAIGGEAVMGVMYGLLVARSRNAALMTLSLLFGALFLLTVGIGAFAGGVVGCATAVLVFYLLYPAPWLFIGLRGDKDVNVLSLLPLVYLPILAALPAFFAAEGIRRLLIEQPRAVILLAMTIGFFIALWIGLRVVTPAALSELINSTRPLVSRVLKRK